MPIWGDGTVERDFLHVSDVAQAFLAAIAAETPPNTVNIGSGQAVSLKTVLAETENAIGRKIAVAYDPGRIVDVKRNVLDTQRASETLGWSAKIKLSDGLSRTAEWWKQVS